MNDTRTFECPECGSSHFGSSGRDGVWQYHCHDEYGRGCHWAGDWEECAVPDQKLINDRLEALRDASEILGPWISASLSDKSCSEYQEAAEGFLRALHDALEDKEDSHEDRMIGDQQ